MTFLSSLILVGIFAMMMMPTSTLTLADDSHSIVAATTAAAESFALSLAVVSTTPSGSEVGGKLASDKVSLSALAATPPYSLSIFAWNGRNSASCPLAAHTLNVTCGRGGVISIYEKERATCAVFGSNLVKCTLPRNATSPGLVAIKCLKSFRPTAVVASTTHAGCRKAASIKNALQVLALGQACNETLVYSRTCGSGSILGISSSSPYCYRSSSTCKSTSTTQCSVTVGPVSMTASKVCIITKPLL